MGTSTDAILAYGYDLSGEPWKIRETDEYGGIDADKLAWYDEDNEEADFDGQAEHRLLVAAGFTEVYEDGRPGYFAREEEARARLGVAFETYCKDDYPLYILAAKVITVSRGDSQVLDLPALMGEPAEHGWDDKLRAACQVLGITPTQASPGWVLVSYWG